MQGYQTIWQKLKAWVDGEETLLHADDYIAKKGQKKPKKSRIRWKLEELKTNKTIYGFLCVLIAAVFIAIMLLVVRQLPTFGDPIDPANNEVMERYLEKGVEETGAINFVAGMILDYRAFDTFGEANVLFLAVMGVLLLLQKDEKNRSAAEEKEIAEDDFLERSDYKSILTVGAKVLTPVIILYGAYVILNGHLSPGGGFSGGTIIGAGLILYATAYGVDKVRMFLSFRRFTYINVGCLLTYFACKSYSFFTGANHVGYAIPKGTPGNILSAGFILPLNICVGLIVACTMYGFYALFTKGDI